MTTVRQFLRFQWPLDNALATLINAVDNGSSTSTQATLLGSGYSLTVVGANLSFDNSGMLIGGTVTGVTVFEGGVKSLSLDGLAIDAAAARNAFDNDLAFTLFTNDPIDFNASSVGAGPAGEGIGEFFGSTGKDFFSGSQGADVFIGLAGNDTLIGNGGDDTLWGDEGNDLARGGAGSDLLRGYLGKDTLDGGTGNDELLGGAGNDNLLGGKGSDFLAGDAGNDTIDGGAGRDWIAGSLIATAKGVTIDLTKKTVTGAFGVDKFVNIESAYGGNGADTLRGDSGNNNLVGLDGKDRLFGAAGNDKIWSGLGQDTTSGGSGNDQFVFFEWGKKYFDHITDFQHGQDKILLVVGTFDELALGKLKGSNFVVGTQAKDADDHLIYDKAHAKLYYDPDGSGGAQGPGLIATFDNHATLSASDFKVVSFTTFTDFWV